MLTTDDAMCMCKAVIIWSASLGKSILFMYKKLTDDNIPTIMRLILWSGILTCQLVSQSCMHACSHKNSIFSQKYLLYKHIPTATINLSGLDFEPRLGFICAHDSPEKTWQMINSQNKMVCYIKLQCQSSGDIVESSSQQYGSWLESVAYINTCEY